MVTRSSVTAARTTTRPVLIVPFAARAPRRRVRGPDDGRELELRDRPVGRLQEAAQLRRGERAAVGVREVEARGAARREERGGEAAGDAGVEVGVRDGHIRRAEQEVPGKVRPPASVDLLWHGGFAADFAAALTHCLTKSVRVMRRSIAMY